MTALFGLGPTGPVSVQIGSGLSLNVNTLIATGAGQTASPSLSLYALGNTTSSTSSAVGGAGSLSLSGAGIVSVGLSGSVYVISASAAAAATSLGQTALGNTVGSTSSQTRALTAETVSFGGIVSGGFSGSTLFISATSGTALNRFAIGNTTGSSSSTSVPLTNWTISATGGISAGFSGSTLILSAATQSVQTLALVAAGNTAGSTTSLTIDARSVTLLGSDAAAVGFSGGSIVISASTGAGGTSATSMGLTALGNTAGSTSSQTRALTAETLSFAGGVSGGFSGGTLVISGATTAVPGGTLSFWEEKPPDTLGAHVASVLGTMHVCPINPPSAVSFNQFVNIVSRSSNAATLSVTSSAASSFTATASNGYNQTNYLALYSRVDDTNYTVYTSTSLTMGATTAFSVSATGSSLTVTASVTFAYHIGTVGSTDTFTAGSTNNGSTYALGAGVNISWNGQMSQYWPWAASIQSGFQLVGIMYSGAVATGTGSSRLGIGTAGWTHSNFFGINQINGGNPFLVGPGSARGVTVGQAYGIGVTNSAGNAVPASIAITALITNNAASLRPIYLRMGMMP